MHFVEVLAALLGVIGKALLGVIGKILGCLSEMLFGYMFEWIFYGFGIGLWSVLSFFELRN